MRTAAIRRALEAPDAGELVREARAWIADCTWGDVAPDEISELEPAEVLLGVANHYAGGLEQFRRDSLLDA